MGTIYINPYVFGSGGGGDPDPEPGADPHFASVVFLSHFDGADGATSAIDQSNSGHTIGFFNGAALDTDQAKFGSSSVLFDGVDDQVIVADSADWLFDGPFTIEAFARPADTGVGVRGIVSQQGGAGARSWSLHQSATSAFFQASLDGTNNVVSLSGGGLVAGTWAHVCAERNASDLIRLYIDGGVVSSVTQAGSLFDSSQTMRIGRSGNNFFNGHIDEVRITKGVARYDGAFTVPSEAFPDS